MAADRRETRILDGGLGLRPLPTWFRPVMAFLLVALSFASFAGLLFYSENRENLIMLMFGFISGSCLGPIVQYIFGSSQSNTDKEIETDKMIDELTKRS